MNIKNGILNVPEHNNKYDLIHFVTSTDQKKIVFIPFNLLKLQQIISFA